MGAGWALSESVRTEPLQQVPAKGLCSSCRSASGRRLFWLELLCAATLPSAAVSIPLLPPCCNVSCMLAQGETPWPQMCRRCQMCIGPAEAGPPMPTALPCRLLPTNTLARPESGICAALPRGRRGRVVWLAEDGWLDKRLT